MNRRQYLKSCILFGASYMVPKLVYANNKSVANVKSQQMRFNIALKNEGNTKLENPLFWLVVPVSAGRQKLKDIKASVGFDLVPDVLGQNVMVLNLSNIGPFSTKLVNVTAEVELFGKLSQPALDSGMWLEDERLIESTSPPIKQLASQLKRESEAATSFAIYQWVSESIHYAGYISDNLGALYALKNLKGDCTEYACLVAALARANGIPARMVGGYVLNSGHITKARDYHHWSEVYFDGEWHLMDAQKKNWLSTESSYIAYSYYQTMHPTKVGHAKRYKVSSKLNVTY